MVSERPDFELYAMTHRMSGDLPESRRYLLDLYIKPGMKVLDIGCGDGQHLEYLVRYLSKDLLIGTEISQIRVDRVREKGFRCIKVEDGHLPFESGQFDAVVFFEVIEHLPEMEVPLMLSEMTRVLKPEGVVIGSTPNYPAKRFYSFTYRFSDRLRQIMRGIKCAEGSRTANDHYDSSNNFNEIPNLKTNCSRLDWIRSNIGRLLADDPTHQFFCNFDVIRRLGEQYFKSVELYTTFSGRAKKVSTFNPVKYASHKIAFVFKK